MIENRTLVIGAKEIAVSTVPTKQSVLMHLALPSDETGLVPGLSVAVGLSPTEARQIGQALVRKADEAEQEQHQA